MLFSRFSDRLRQYALPLLVGTICFAALTYGAAPCDRIVELALKMEARGRNVFTGEGPISTPVRQLGQKELQKHFKPDVVGVIAGGYRVEMKLDDVSTFLASVKSLETSGIWHVFYPNRVDNLAGHSAVIAGDQIFHRLGDAEGPRAVESAPVSRVLDGLMDAPFVVAQFFELSPGTVRETAKFFNDRVWFFHQNNPIYRTRFSLQPASRNRSDPLAENCSIFAFSFLLPYWHHHRPDVTTAVSHELGMPIFSELPTRQTALGTRARAYRGTVVVSGTPAEMKAKLLDGRFQSDHFGQQLFLSGPVVEAPAGGRP